MIYVVKCYSCEHEFKIKRGETGADMMCPHCGTANNIRDVIERIEDEPGKVDPDMQAIKNFDMAENPVDEAVGWISEEKRRRKNRIRSIGYLFILLLLILHFFGIVDFFALIEKIAGLFELRR